MKMAPGVGDKESGARNGRCAGGCRGPTARREELGHRGDAGGGQGRASAAWGRRAREGVGGLEPWIGEQRLWKGGRKKLNLALVPS